VDSIVQKTSHCGFRAVFSSLAFVALFQEYAELLTGKNSAYLARVFNPPNIALKDRSEKYVQSDNEDSHFPV
jgi:hypothetical protein